MIRDRLVCGVSHEPRLLAEKDLTYEKAIEIAQAVKAAEKNTKIIKNGNGKQTIHYAGTATSKQADKKVPVNSLGPNNYIKRMRASLNNLQ